MTPPALTTPPARLQFEGHGYAYDPDKRHAWRGVEVVRADAGDAFPKAWEIIRRASVARDDETRPALDVADADELRQLLTALYSQARGHAAR